MLTSAEAFAELLASGESVDGVFSSTSAAQPSAAQPSAAESGAGSAPSARQSWIANTFAALAATGDAPSLTLVDDAADEILRAARQHMPVFFGPQRYADALSAATSSLRSIAKVPAFNCPYGAEDPSFTEAWGVRGDVTRQVFSGIWVTGAGDDADPLTRYIETHLGEVFGSLTRISCDSERVDVVNAFLGAAAELAALRLAALQFVDPQASDVFDRTGLR